MPMPSIMLTLLLNAAPSNPSLYVATPFAVEKGTPQTLSARYAQHTEPGAQTPTWEESPDFVSLQTQIREGKVTAPLSETDKALLHELGALVRGKPEQAGRWYTLPAESKTPPPEDLPVSESLNRMLNLGQTKLAPAKEVAAQDGKARKGRSRQTLSNLLLLEGSPTDVKKVYFKKTVLRMGRTMRSETSHAIAVFEGGKLQRLVSLDTRGHDFLMDGSEMPAYSVQVNVMVPGYSDGKVSRLELTRLADEDGAAEDEPQPGITLQKETYQAITRS